MDSLHEAEPSSHPEALNAANTERPPLRSIAGLLVIESVFTVVGGFMDSYAYVAHGHVFANAQTGNVVLFAVHAAAGDWSQALRHVPPVAACILGVSAAKLSGVHSDKVTFHATLFCQTIELAVLAALAIFASRMPDACVVPILSFVAALQITSFDKVGPWSFNSAMTTGNIRGATTGFVLWLKGEERPKNLGNAVVSMTAVVSFLAGAVVGGFYTFWHKAQALVPLVALVFIGLLFTWRRHRVNTK